MKKMIPKKIRSAVPLALILMINAAFLSVNAFRTLIINDWGANMDLGWRVLQGQKPYIDFIYTSGPIHPYLMAFFFHLFGVGKIAILTHLISISSVVIVVTFLIAQRHLSGPKTALVTTLTATCFYWPISHPWYSASAHLWGILAIGLYCLRQPMKSASKALGTAIPVGVLVCLSFMTKMNIGSAYLLVFLLVFLISPWRQRSLGGYVLGILLTCGAMSLLIPAALYFKQAFEIYIFTPGTLMFYRLTRLYREPLGWFTQIYWIPLVILIPQLRTLFRRHREFLGLFLGVLFIAILSARTSSTDDPANTHLTGIELGLAFILMSKVKENLSSARQKTLHTLSAGALTLTTLGFIVYTSHFGLTLATEREDYGRNLDNRYTFQATSFKGWSGPQETLEPLEQIVTYFDQHIPEEESLLILTDMYVVYALTGRESYRGVPYVFSAYVPWGELIRSVHETVTHRPPTWILTDTRRSRISPGNDTGSEIIQHLGLGGFIKQHYTPHRRWGDYVLLRREKGSSLDLTPS